MTRQQQQDLVQGLRFRVVEGTQLLVGLHRSKICMTICTAGEMYGMQHRRL
jgi:hypothetical protein